MRRFCLLLLTTFGVTCVLSADEHRPFALAQAPSTQTVITEPDRNDSQPFRAPADLPHRRTQWLMFTAEWCVPCQSARSDFEPWMKHSGWLVNESPEAHLRLVDGDDHPSLIRQQGIRSFPTFVLMQDGREIRRQEGYPGRMELVRQYLDVAKTAPPAVGAISVGTLQGQRDNIANVIATFRPLLGSDGTLTIRLDRPGTPTVMLPLGDRMSIRSDNPLVMDYSLKGDVLTCRFAQPYPRGRFTFGLPVEQSVAAVSLSVSEVILELPHAPDVRLRVEP